MTSLTEMLLWLLFDNLQSVYLSICRKSYHNQRYDDDMKNTEYVYKSVISIDNYNNVKLIQACKQNRSEKKIDEKNDQYVVVAPSFS